MTLEQAKRILLELIAALKLTEKERETLKLAVKVLTEEK